ncbi:MAG: hypothetical protein OEY67_07725 [Gammaproteobacteria bacterium]|nr:hypothetical protein [Gammaproteobacteria bacterium]
MESAKGSLLIKEKWTSIAGRMLASLFLCGAVIVFTSLASADDYLDQLKAEADTLETMSKAKAEESKLKSEEAKAESQPQTSATEIAPRKRHEFEQELQKKYPGNYVLYTMLAPENKAKVYRAYAESNRVGPGRFVIPINKIIEYSR